METPKLLTRNDDKSKDGSLSLLNWISIFLLAFGILIVLIFGTSTSAKATIFLWMLACLLSGTAIGFLFGIPKILQNTPAAGTAAPAYQQQVNTNLTEISDWLTKIIVGLGLVSLTKIPPYLASIAKLLATGLSDPKGSGYNMAVAFAYGTIICYVILGFLFGYITTRLYLAGEFSKADQAAIQSYKRIAEDAAGAAQSALQKIDFALTKPAVVEKGPNQDPIAGLTELGNQYVQVRSSMPSGGPRTKKMTEIFKAMTEAASEVDVLDVSQLLKDTDIGKRLMAYAYLYSKPDYDSLEQLIDAIISDPTPFGQYWGIQVLGKLIELKPSTPISPAVFKKLKDYYDKLNKGIDREYELRKIIPTIKT